MKTEASRAKNSAKSIFAESIEGATGTKKFGYLKYGSKSD